MLQNKIDFTVIFTAQRANPNGDPLDGNRPRIDYDGYGEVSDVCLKRKIRNRLQDFGEPIFVQMDERKDDGFKSLKDRADAVPELKNAKKDRDKYAEVACREWTDVRSFGQVFAFGGANKGSGVSVGVRGPVTVQTAVSAEPIDITSMQITKSVNSVTKNKEDSKSEDSESEDKKSSDTMGTKHRVDFGVYKFSGSINVQLAEKTGFSERDAELIHRSLITLFENDCSSARPDGSMEVVRVYWWKHNCKSGQYSSAKVHRSVEVNKVSGDGKRIEDYEIKYMPLDGLEAEIYEYIR